MAQLKNTLVTGNLKITNKTTTDSLQVTTVYAKANSTATTYGVGTNGQVLKSNGTMTYWATDANDNNYDRLRYQKAIKASTAITAKNIIVPNSGGAYYHLKSGNAFDIRFPILYAGSDIAQSATGTNNYIVFAVAIATTQSMTLTAHQPVYIKGTLLGKAFTPVSTTPLTQTVPTTEDGYHYMLLGLAYSTTEMYLLEDHNIYEFSNGYFRKLGDDTSKTLRYDLTNKTVDLNALTLGDNSKISERHYICYSSGGSTAISNKPDSNNISFILDVYQLRWTSTTDFYVVQIYEDIYFHKFRRRKTSSTAAWTAWKRIPDEGDYYTSAICDDAADIQHKAARFDSYVLRTGNKFQLSICNGNSYAGSWSLNVNGTGAKTVYLNGTATQQYNYALPGGIYDVVYGSDDRYHIYQFNTPIQDSRIISPYTGDTAPTYIKIGEIADNSYAGANGWIAHFRIHVGFSAYMDSAEIYDILCGGGRGHLSAKSFNILTTTSTPYCDKIVLNSRIASSRTVCDILLHFNSNVPSSITYKDLYYKIDVLDAGETYTIMRFNILSTATNYTTTLVSNSVQVSTSAGTQEATH